jgi:hypothetical protein
MPASPTLSNIARRFRHVRNAIAKSPARFVGIDVGVRAITVASLGATSDKRRQNLNSSPLTWQSLATVPLSFDPSGVPSPEWIEDTIRTLKHQIPRTTDNDRSLAAISLPSTWVHYQVVPGRSLPSCQSQADQLFRNSVFNSDAHQTHWPVVGLQHGTPNVDDQYVVASTARKAASQIASAVADVGYEVQCILPQGAALLHAAKYLTSLEPQCAVLLDVYGGLVAVNHHAGQESPARNLANGCGLCRSLPAVDPEAAAQISKGGIGLSDVLPWLSDVANEINATLNYSNRANMCGDSSLPIMICGELASIDGLDAELATRTNRPVARWQYAGLSRPFHPDTTSHPAVEDNCGDPSWAMALSLAHQSAMVHENNSGMGGGMRL